MKKIRNNAVGPQVRQQKEQVRFVPALCKVSALLLGSLGAGTQYFADLYDYQPALGDNLHGVYAPWKLIEWYIQWQDVYASDLGIAAGISSALAVTSLSTLFFIRQLRRNTSKANEYMHGSARWADRADIEQAGLFSDKGVVVGAWRDKNGRQKYLRHNGPEHVLCFAPTRSGKGVGLVLPTLLSWEHSAVITDLKGELWALTAGWRKEHANNKVLRFEPGVSSGCIGFNPLEEIRIGTEHEVGDVQNLATLLVDPDGKGLNNHWQKTAQSLFVGCIIHLLYKTRNDNQIASLSMLDAMLADTTRPIGLLWKEMKTYSHINGKNHPVAAATGQDMLDRPDEEAGSVLSTAKSYLTLFRDPVVAANISRSEFRIRDLMHHETPVSLYIITEPKDKSRMQPIVRIMVNMIVRLLAEKMEFDKGSAVKKYKHRLLMMLDEFPSLGKLEIMQESLAFVAGYGIKCYLVVQDMQQLYEAYGQYESIVSNCHIQNAFPPNNVKTAEHLSKLTGQTTIVKEAITVSGKRGAGFMSQASRTMQEVQRPLLTVDESIRMPGPVKDAEGQIKSSGDMVIYASGFPAIYGVQPLFFQDLAFQARSKVPAPNKTDKLLMVSNPKTVKKRVAL